MGGYISDWTLFGECGVLKLVDVALIPVVLSLNGEAGVPMLALLRRVLLKSPESS